MTKTTTQPARVKAGRPEGGQYTEGQHTDQGGQVLSIPVAQADPPTQVWPDGTKVWKNAEGQLHRLGAPAVEGPDGFKAFFFNGQRHNLNGPAVIEPDGTEKFFVRDKLMMPGNPDAFYPDYSKFFLIDGESYLAETDPLVQGLAHVMCSSEINQDYLVKLKSELIGHSIVAAGRSKYGAYTMTLDNGVECSLVGESDCCAYAEVSRELPEGNFNNIITDVVVTNQPVDLDEEDEHRMIRENYDPYNYRISLVYEDSRVGTDSIDIEADGTSGYYVFGISVDVVRKK